jgi:hypothetical protein
VTGVFELDWLHADRPKNVLPAVVSEQQSGWAPVRVRAERLLDAV